MRAKKRRHDRGGKKKNDSVTIRLTEEEREILHRQAADFKCRTDQEYAGLLLRMTLWDLECTAMVQEEEHGVRFADPEDCTCCKGRSH